MEIDWEVEVGGDAPVIEAHWAGFVDLRAQPHRITDISEATNFPRLADLLSALNSKQSRVWTSKCDVWEPEPGSVACYIDILPVSEGVFDNLQGAERFSRELAARLASSTAITDYAHSSRHPILAEDAGVESQASIVLVIRAATTERAAEGFGVTAYLSATPSGSFDAKTALAAAMDAFSNAVLALSSQERPKQS